MSTQGRQLAVHPVTPFLGDLAAISQAKTLLENSTDLREIRDIGDKAEAIRQYLKASGESLDVQNVAGEIRLRADRRAGSLLANMDRLKRGRPKKKPTIVVGFPSMAEIGITHNQASRLKLEADVPEKQFERWIGETKDAAQELTVSGLRLLGRKIKSEKDKQKRAQQDVESHGIVTNLHDLVAVGAKFNCIYADPPWAYSNNATRASVGGLSDSAYKSTMSVDEICAEPVSQLAADESHLHLWTTNAFIFEAKRVIDAWGFEYKSCFVWVKPQLGIGNYWRVSHEFLLLGVRGGLRFQDMSLKSWIEADRVGHSIKPRIIRELIMKASPAPYLEMYGREKPSDDWTVYGNEIKESLF